MLTPAFQLYLNEKIQRGQATIGKYDGQHACLTCASAAGKIFIHSPHEQGPGGQSITYLNINRHVTALAAGMLDPTSGRDVLLIGTPNNLQCYDPHRNQDLFFKDVPDGVNALAVGKLGARTEPLAIVGGNCSVQGFQLDGQEAYWTVTGDNVSAMALCDINNDGCNELLVASDDFDIRVFADEDVIGEASEADQFVGLCHVSGSRFAYALRNGTVGVYDGMQRQWRVKSKHTVCALACYDLDGDGVPEIISGWSNGRVEVRRLDTGAVTYRDHLGASVAAILRADYRGDGREVLVVCSTEGEVKGYLPRDAGGGDVADEGDYDADVALLQQQLSELNQQKQELQQDLAALQDPGLLDRRPAVPAPLASTIAAVPASTALEPRMTVNQQAGCCDLMLRTNNEAVIKGVIVFAEHLFEGESLLVYPKTPSQETCVQLRAGKDVPVLMMFKVLVGARSGTAYHVLELDLELPKYSMYAAVPRSVVQDPQAGVRFTISHPPQRVGSWLASRFNGQEGAHRAGHTLEACFTCLRDQQPLLLRVSAAGPSQPTQVTIRSSSMELAGELIQDLAAYLAVPELQCIAEFPAAMEAFRAVLAKVEAYNSTRMKLAADVADSSNLVKALVVRAEDCRILGDMTNMRKQYRQLMDLNRDLITEHGKRATNHSELLDALKEVNQMIQRAARLRVGSAKAHVVAACRQAVKDNNLQALFQIIQDGDAPM